MKIVGLHLEPGGVGWHRCWNWTSGLERLGHTVWHRPHQGKQFEWNELDDILCDADVVIAGRMAHGQVFAGLLAGRDKYGYKLVIDTDDQTDEIPAYNYAHPDYHPGTNISRLVRQELKLADLVTVSTEPLRVWASQYARNIVVVPNVVDTRMHEGAVTRSKEPRHADDIRIYWGGGGGHYGDLLTIREPLLQIFHERPNVKLVFSLFIPDWAADLPPFRVFMIRFAQLKMYPRVLKWLCADVALAPLAENTFNRCKSHVKYLDYAMAGVPGVYQDMEPYRTVEHGVTGFKARSEDEWYRYINLLLDNRAVHNGIVQSSYRDVFDNWNVDRHILRYEAMLHELTAQKSRGLSMLTEGVPVEASCLMQSR